MSVVHKYLPHTGLEIQIYQSPASSEVVWNECQKSYFFTSSSNDSEAQPSLRKIQIDLAYILKAHKKNFYYAIPFLFPMGLFLFQKLMSKGIEPS